MCALCTTGICTTLSKAPSVLHQAHILHTATPYTCISDMQYHPRNSIIRCAKAQTKYVYSNTNTMASKPLQCTTTSHVNTRWDYAMHVQMHHCTINTKAAVRWALLHVHRASHVHSGGVLGAASAGGSGAPASAAYSARGPAPRDGRILISATLPPSSRTMCTSSARQKWRPLGGTGGMPGSANGSPVWWPDTVTVATMKPPPSTSPVDAHPQEKSGAAGSTAPYTRPSQSPRA
mmetsp:Transcript_35316/g.89398  ORF Transcript_35316/g.89398 Transcript_35316/m.89398 type:complete len:234 (+) Transcript_35316:101-802(+)